MKFEKTTLISSLRKAFFEFWKDQLHIESFSDGLVVAPPLLYADGWQVTVYLEPLTPKQWRMSDRGTTLGKLLDAGMHPLRGNLKTTIEQQSAFYDFNLDGLQIQKLIPYPFDITEFQVFAESLVALSHLLPKGNPKFAPSTGSQLEDRLSSFFYNRHLNPLRRHKLRGMVESEITVDFYLEGPRPLALQPVHRSRNLLSYMEQWGWRWTDLKNQHPDMIRAMVYDPDNQQWDESSLRIGNKVCEIFTPFSETEAALDEILSA